MPRKRVPRNLTLPYHVYNRSQDKQFYCSLNKLWAVAVEALTVATYAYNLRVHAFILMSNHYHLLASAPDGNLGDGIGYFQIQFSKWSHSCSNSQTYRFSGRYHCSLICSSEHFTNVYLYIYRNPLRAKLVKDASLYPFSSLSWKMGQIDQCCPVYRENSFGLDIPNNPLEELCIVNQVPDPIQDERTKRGLRRSYFTPPKRIR